MANPNCSKCKGTGRVKHPDGTVSICFTCLQDGSLDQHNSELKDASDLGIKL
jgi:hypothetical protein